MEVKNYTPLPHLVFEKHGRKNEVFDVIAVRGTFDLVPGAVPHLAPRQQPVCIADSYYGDPETSSLRSESDLAVFKPSADVLVTGHARTFNGIAMSEWIAGVRVGSIEKAVRITGPRAWERTMMGGWKLSAPRLTTEVPLRYELAYGGRYPKSLRKLEPGRQPAYIEHPYNPVGRGWVSQARLEQDEPIPAPQIEDPGEPIIELNQNQRPHGFGPISRWWQPRVQYAGTYDEIWRSEQFPDLPLDFQDAFYNCAHPDLICQGRYLNGNEQLSLVGIFTAGLMESSLPGVVLQGEMVDSNGDHHAIKPLLDTVIIDTDSRTVSLVWRSTLPRQWNVFGVVLYPGKQLDPFKVL